MENHGKILYSSMVNGLLVHINYSASPNAFIFPDTAKLHLFPERMHEVKFIVVNGT